MEAKREHLQLIQAATDRAAADMLRPDDSCSPEGERAECDHG